MILMLSVLLSVVIGYTLFHSMGEADQASYNKLRNELSNHLNIAAGIQARERGFGNTVIGGNYGLIERFRELSVEGDQHAEKARAFADKIIAHGNVSSDFTDRLNWWLQSLENLRNARPKVGAGEISAREWLHITTTNIQAEFDLQDSIFVPITETESVLYYNSLLRPNIALLAEYAGRERAIIGNLIARNSSISEDTKTVLDDNRSQVNRVIRQIQIIRDNVSTRPELKDAILRFEEEFLGGYEDLRSEIYRIGELNNQASGKSALQLQQSSELIVETLKDVGQQLLRLTNNPNLQDQVRRQMNDEPTDWSRVRLLFQDLAEIQHKYKQLRFLDETGWEQLRIDYNDGKGRIIPSFYLQDKSSRYYFMDSKDLPKGEVYISKLDLNVENDEISYPFEPMIRFSAPVFVGDKRHGVVVLNIDARKFLNELPNDVIMADKDGFYLHHPDVDMEWGMMDSLGREQHNLNMNFPEISDIIYTGNPEQIHLGHSSYVIHPVFYHPDDPNRYWVLIRKYAPIPYPVNAGEWIERSTQAINSALDISLLLGDMAEASSESKTRSANLNVVLSIAFVFFLVIYIYLFFRELGKAGRKTDMIGDELRQMALGDLSRRIDVSMTEIGRNDKLRPLDEIDMMAVNINIMAAGLEIQTTELEKAKEDAEKASQAKSEFLASMSHELRTPMTGIIGFADILLDDDISDDTRYKVQRMKGAASSLLKIINDVLDMSKLESGKLEIETIDFDLQALITDLLEIFHEKRREKKDVDLVIEFTDSFPKFIRSDPTRIRQILLNLLGNAFKFTTEGTITIHGKSELHDDQSYMHISIIDTGIGIEKEAQAKLFSDFVQADASISRKYEGSGLGLSICRRLVTLMGGDIGLESTVGTGSTFWFTLPYSEALSETGPEPQLRRASGYVTTKRLNILIAEDNRLNQLIIKTFMEKYDHHTEIVENGALAVEAHARGDYDLILMDVRMPEMSGPDATRQIRKSKHHPDIPILALTADAMEEHKKGYFEAGMNGCVTKPIDQAELLETINTVLGETIHSLQEMEETESPAGDETTGQQVDNGPEEEDMDEDIASLLKQFEDIADDHEA